MATTISARRSCAINSWKPLIYPSTALYISVVSLHNLLDLLDKESHLRLKHESLLISSAIFLSLRTRLGNFLRWRGCFAQNGLSLSNQLYVWHFVLILTVACRVGANQASLEDVTVAARVEDCILWAL